MKTKLINLNKTIHNIVVNQEAINHLLNTKKWTSASGVF